MPPIIDQKDDNENNEVKISKHRSPNYPVIGLRRAFDKIHDLASKYKRATVPINLAHECMGVKAHGGLGNQYIAALKTYGFLEVEGEGPSRRVRLTETANRIIGKAPNRSQLLKDAALKPAIYAEIWQKYLADGMPDEEILKHYLVWEREEGKFNPDSVDAFIANFKDSVEFAGLTDTDGVSSLEGKQSDTKDEPENTEQKPSEFRPRTRRPVQSGIKEAVFPLEEGEAVLQWPEHLSKESFEDFESWLQLLLRKTKRSIDAPVAPVSAKRYRTEYKDGGPDSEDDQDGRVLET